MSLSACTTDQTWALVAPGGTVTGSSQAQLCAANPALCAAVDGSTVRFELLCLPPDALPSGTVTATVSPSLSVHVSAPNATPEQYQALVVIFAALLAAMSVVWGVKQVLGLFKTSPES